MAPLKSALERRGFALKFLSDGALANCARITLGTESENAELADTLRELLPSLLTQ